jgi:hypothetical protein
MSLNLSSICDVAEGNVPNGKGVSPKRIYGVI